MPDDAAWQEFHRGAGGLVTLGESALVHEASAALADRSELSFPDRSRFLADMARSMRGLVIDSARERQAPKRGGEFHITRLDTRLEQNLPEVEPLERRSAALDALAVHEPRLAGIVDRKYFCGFPFIDIAAMSGVSERTVQRPCEKARLLLFAESGGDTPAA